MLYIFPATKNRKIAGSSDFPCKWLVLFEPASPPPSHKFSKLLFFFHHLSQLLKFFFFFLQLTFTRHRRVTTPSICVSGWGYPTRSAVGKMALWFKRSFNTASTASTTETRVKLSLRKTAR